MKKFTKNLLAFVAISFTSAGYTATVSFADVGNPACSNKKDTDSVCATVLLQGEIKSGDADKLRQILDRANREKNLLHVGQIYLDSRGGDIIEAMELGRMVRQNAMSSQITHDSVCYSACIIVHLGGVSRFPVGEVGIHSFYSRDFIGTSDFSAASDEYNKVAEVVSRYMKEMRIPLALLDAMIKVPHRDMKVLNFEEKKEFFLLGVDPVYSQAQSKNPSGNPASGKRD